MTEGSKRHPISSPYTQECEKIAVKMGKRPFDIAVSDYFKGNDLLSNK